MPRSLAHWAFLLVSISLLSASTAPAAETLRWKFQEGDTHHFTLVQETDNITQANNQEINVKTSQTVDMTWSIKSVDSDGTAKMNQTIDRFRMSLEAPGGNSVSIDTNDKNPPTDPVGKAVAPFLEAWVGTPITLTMSNLGEVQDVEVPPSLIEKMKNAGPAGQALGNLATEEGMKKLISHSILVLPSKSVEKGATWSRPLEFSMPQLTMKIANTYTYQGVSQKDGANEANIDLSMKIEEIKSGKDVPIDITLDKQEGSGSYEFNTDKGWLDSSEVKQNVSMNISANGQTFSTETHSSTRFTRKD